MTRPATNPRTNPRMLHALVLALGALVTITATTKTWAGPPLLCPDFGLTAEELKGLEALKKEHDTAPKLAVALVRHTYSTDVARFRVEALRWFFRQHSSDLPLLVEALETRIESEKRPTTPQQRFELALVRLMADWNDDDAIANARTMTLVADETGEPALLLLAAEAWDLVVNGESRETRDVASVLSLVQVRRAIDTVTGSTDPEHREVAAMLRKHLEYLRSMHSREPEWQDVRVPEAKAAAKR